MADANKNILITPNVGTATVFPKIEFTGFDNNTLTLSVLDDGTLSIDGSSGQLFSVADSMSGTIFSVNDVSGIPSIEVIDDGTVIFAEFAGNVGVGIDAPSKKLHLVGDALFNGSLLIQGTDTNLSVSNDEIRLTGYGMVGNRGKLYITNPTSVQIGVGATHAADPAMDFGSAVNTSFKTLYENSNRVFHDGYHPNADTWTTGRTITLTGDVTGTSAAWNGSGNISFATTVANDSHTHSNYLLNTSDTLVGNFINNGNISIGILATTATGALLLTGSTANKQSELKCTNGNLHIDAAAGTSGTYLNYYTGTGGVLFGNGAGGSNANVTAAGVFTGTLFNGEATSARYADLAEKYLGDDKYDVGTVMSIGSIKEVTATTEQNQHSILGVISDAPAYLMNADLEDGQTVALKGRVPVKVTGTVLKGDRLVASHLPGIAKANNDVNVRSFAIALEDNITGVIEAVIL